MAGPSIGWAAIQVIPSLQNVRQNLEKGLAGPSAAAGATAGKKFSEGMAKNLKSTGASMQKVGALATVGLTAPILAGFKKAADAASGLNESVNATNVVFGEAAGTIADFAKSAAKDAGLSQRAFNELVTPIGAMLQNVGFGADEAATSSVNLAKRAADMASVFNVDVSEALGAIQAGLRGEADPLERFGVGLSDAAVTAHAMELGLADADGQLDANAKTQARLSLLMEQTDSIAGDFANTSGEVANQQRIAAAEAENLAAKFGQKLLPIKGKMIEMASGLLERFNSLSPSMQNTALASAGVAAAAGPAAVALGSVMRATGSIIEHGPKIASAVGNVGSRMAGLAAAAWTAAVNVGRAATSMIVSAAQATARVVASIAAQVARWVVLGAQSLAQAARVALAWLIAIGPIALVIAAVVGLVVLIVKNWDTILRVTKAIWNAVWTFIKNIATSIKDWVVRTFTSLRDGTVSLWTRTRDSVVDLATRMRDWVVDRVTSLRDRAVAIALDLLKRYVNFWTDLRDRVVALAVALRDGVVSRATALRDAMVKLGDMIRDRVVKAFTDLKDRAVARARELVDWVRGLPGRVVSALGKLGSTLLQAGKDLIGGLIKGALAKIKSIGSDIGKALGGAFKKAFSFIPGFGDGPGLGGTDSGMWRGQPRQVQAMMGMLNSAVPGTSLISGLRPGAITSTGNPSYHGKGRAVDTPPDRRTAAWINGHFFAQTRELITPWQQLNIHNGRRFSYSPGVMALHTGRMAHNHWAMATGAYIKNKLTLDRVTMGERHPEIVAPEPMLRSIVREETAGHADQAAVFHLYDKDGVLLGTMQGVARDEFDVGMRRVDRQLHHHSRTM